MNGEEVVSCLLGAGQAPPLERVRHVRHSAQLALGDDGRQAVALAVRKDRGRRRPQDAVRDAEEVGQGDAVDQVGHLGHRDLVAVHLHLSLRESIGEKERSVSARARRKELLGERTPRSSTWTILLSSAIAKLLLSWFLALLSSTSVIPFRMGLVIESSCCAINSGVRYRNDGSTEIDRPKRPLSR